VSDALTLRPMTGGDLPLIAEWLRQPHVARWWREDPADELATYRACIDGTEKTHALVAEHSGTAMGWCQWYRWGDYPGAARDYGAEGDEAGIDYAIGAAEHCGRGLGTQLIARLVELIRAGHPQLPIYTTVEEPNRASRRVLEKNGFCLIAVRKIEAEIGDGPNACYRLDGPLSPG
jgi:aminoglycoside 6'-N-acetyltransferase